MKKQVLSEQFRRMQKLAGIVNESKFIQLTENVEGLPQWVESIEYEDHHGELSLIVGKNWFATNKKQLEDNIEDHVMFYSSQAGNSLKNFPNYDPKQDYISDEGTTYIDGKPGRTNQGDNLNSRKGRVESAIKEVFTKYLIDIKNSNEKYYVKNIISNQEMDQIKKFAEDKYKKITFIYIEGK